MEITMLKNNFCELGGNELMANNGGMYFPWSVTVNNLGEAAAWIIGGAIGGGVKGGVGGYFGALISGAISQNRNGTGHHYGRLPL